MANSKTQHAERPIYINNAVNKTGLIPITVVLDTPGDFTIYTPGAGNMVLVVGMEWAESTAGNLTIKSGSTELNTLELPGNHARSERVDGSILYATAPGEPLKLNASVGVSKLLVHVVEAAQVFLEG